jgi:hypothetical protein
MIADRLKRALAARPTIFFLPQLPNSWLPPMTVVTNHLLWLHVQEWLT